MPQFHCYFVEVQEEYNMLQGACIYVAKVASLQQK